MLSEEEIVHSLLKEIKEGFRDIEFIGNNLYPLDPNQFRALSEYIYKLESDKQKLIEKLEEDIKNKEILIELEYEGYKKYYARTGGYPNQMKFNVFKLTGEKNKAQEILEFIKNNNQVTVK